SEALAGKERVGLSLDAKLACGTMSADERNVVAERQQFLLDRADQRLVVASRQVRAPDRATEQHVAHMCEPRRGVVEHDVTRRMSRAMEDLELMAAEAHLLALAEEAIRCAVAHRSADSVVLRLPFDIAEKRRIRLVGSQNLDPQR